MMEVAAKYGVLGEDGKRYYITAWHELDLSNEDEVFNCLAERRSFLAGFPVYQEAFEDAENGITTMPGRGIPGWVGMIAHSRVILFGPRTRSMGVSPSS